MDRVPAEIYRIISLLEGTEIDYEYESQELFLALPESAAGVSRSSQVQNRG